MTMQYPLHIIESNLVERVRCWHSNLQLDMSHLIDHEMKVCKISVLHDLESVVSSSLFDIQNLYHIRDLFLYPRAEMHPKVKHREKLTLEENSWHLPPIYQEYFLYKILNRFLL